MFYSDSWSTGGVSIFPWAACGVLCTRLLARRWEVDAAFSFLLANNLCVLFLYGRLGIGFLALNVFAFMHFCVLVVLADLRHPAVGSFDYLFHFNFRGSRRYALIFL